MLTGTQEGFAHARAPLLSDRGPKRPACARNGFCRRIRAPVVGRPIARSAGKGRKGQTPVADAACFRQADKISTRFAAEAR
jgi:hypothetical protein